MHGNPATTGLPTGIELGRAFESGKQAAQSGNGSVASCPFGLGQLELRASWLHGFKEGQIKKPPPRQPSEVTEPASGGGHLDMVLAGEDDVLNFSGTPEADPDEAQKAMDALWADVRRGTP